MATRQYVGNGIVVYWDSERCFTPSGARRVFRLCSTARDVHGSSSPARIPTTSPR